MSLCSFQVCLSPSGRRTGLGKEFSEHANYEIIRQFLKMQKILIIISTKVCLMCLISQLSLYFHQIQLNTFDKIQRFEEALQNYDSAIQKYPENSNYFYNKGRINMIYFSANTLERLNRFEEVLQNYDLAIQKYPENSDFYQNKGNNENFEFPSQYIRQNEQT
ncbi:unnamed protein product [Paramecium octaurelia]|uniref:Tetratricopeptide repeat protein n=1 Tax=Paramecium octaurelia TaxID=43137 RepID=A0A8S1UH36_PAROT|nr:unnamed protein product [Paramecium octaurelia]